MKRPALFLATVALLFAVSAATAHGFEITMTAQGPVDSLSVGDTVIVDVFLDSDGPITIFSIAVTHDIPSALVYDGAASAALPTNPGAGPFGGSNGNQSSYILYEAVGRNSNFLAPVQTPYFKTFPVTSPVEQVNINYNENALGETNATGTGIYIATLLFNVTEDFDTASLSLAWTSANLIQAGTVVVCDPSNIGSPDCALSPPITLTPEPGLAGMAVASVLTLLGVGAYRRRARR